MFHINGIIQYVVVCDWLLSLSITSSSFIHTVACISISFLFVGKYYFILWICYILSTHSSVDRNLGYFHFFLAMVAHAAISLCMQVSVWTCVLISFRYITRNGISGWYDNSIFNIVRSCQTVFQNGHTISAFL